MRLVIGSRGSQLALWQSKWAKKTLMKGNPELSVEIEVIRTTGDENLAASLPNIGTKGVFTREVDEALLQKRTDFSVHSLKDLPTTFPGGLCLTAVSARADARDALISLDGKNLKQLKEGGVVGTSSLRRQALIRSDRSDLEILPLRGNVDTRLRKLETEGLDAIILASAGLNRLDFKGKVTELLDPTRFVPAAGQGVIAIVSREDDDQTRDLLSSLEDADSRVAITAERAALRDLGGGCRIPFGAWARFEGSKFVLDGVVAHPEEGNPVRSRIEDSPDKANAMGQELAQALLDAGGASILQEVLA